MSEHCRKTVERVGILGEGIGKLRRYSGRKPHAGSQQGPRRVHVTAARLDRLQAFHRHPDPGALCIGCGFVARTNLLLHLAALHRFDIDHASAILSRVKRRLVKGFGPAYRRQHVRKPADRIEERAALALRLDFRKLLFRHLHGRDRRALLHRLRHRERFGRGKLL